MQRTLIFLAVAGIAAVPVARAQLPYQESDPAKLRGIDITVPPSVNPRIGIAVRMDSVLDERDTDPYTVGQGTEKIITLHSQTVADVVSKAVTNGLRKAGYRVLKESDPDYAVAAPLKLTISAFWASKAVPGSEWDHCSTQLAFQIDVKGPLEPFAGSGLSLGGAVEKKSRFWAPCAPHFKTALTKAVTRISDDVAEHSRTGTTEMQ